MAKKQTKADAATREMFSKDELFDDSLQKELEAQKNQPVECLGMTFPNDDARREYFLDKLREKLEDPEFRKTPGFPKGDDEAILRMSDPPYYTACPNPFLGDFIKTYGKPYDPRKKYHRDPFAVNTSVGKSDPLYNTHGYHTKVPHLAIVPSILHYTEPGDIVLDGFAGSGMTGIAAQFCGTAPSSYRRTIEQEWATNGNSPPSWGARRAILNDLSPAASFIDAGYTLQFDVHEFRSIATKILNQVEAEFDWMYRTLHADGTTECRIDYTVWSEVFTCAECSTEVVFVDNAMDPDTRKVSKDVTCPGCGAISTKEKMDLQQEHYHDAPWGRTEQRPKREPVLVRYKYGRSFQEKRPDDVDLETIRRAESLGVPGSMPVDELPDCQMTRVGRMATTNTRCVHHMYTTRTAQVLSRLWAQANEVSNTRIRHMLLYWLDSHFANLSIRNRFRPEVSFPYNPLTGVFYIPSAFVEPDPFKAYRNKLKRMSKGLEQPHTVSDGAFTATGDCRRLGIPGASVDYVFTDPPFGGNIFYADLNFPVEAWHRVWTNTDVEAIVDNPRGKTLLEYQELMRECFSEYSRVLKPGRWITIVFSNSKNAVWHAIQEALGSAGFVVADVRTLDKKQGSFKQVTSTAVKQDLVISAYKPTDALLKQFELGYSTPDAAWSFIREHLSNVPVCVKQGGSLQVLAERTPQMLLDRMIAFHVQRGMGVPLDAGEFLAGLAERFAERDGMYFLTEQVAEYDRTRAKIDEIAQLELFVSDESSAIQWLRRELREKPQTFQDLQPQFMKETGGWSKHETPLDLRVLLEQNFLHYDGKDEVPSQIHAYLSTNYKDLRGKPKSDPGLRAKAKSRWYVPDPNKAGDLEKLRERQLLKEFEEYKASKEKRLKVFRTEAIRAGFKAAYDGQDYKTIVEVAEKLPEAVLQEDEKLLMYFDVAQMRSGKGDDADLFD